MKVNPHAERALKRLAILRDVLSSGPALRPRALRDREQHLAEAIFAARDEALRHLSDEEADAWDAFATETARQLEFAVPLTGHRMTWDDGVSVCAVGVHGRTHPYLLPEHLTWEHQFRRFALGAARNRGADGEIPEEYLTLVRRVGLSASRDDLMTFLTVAVDVTAEVDRIRREPANGEAGSSLTRELNLQRTVLRGRRSLLRRLSRDGWAAIVERMDWSADGLSTGVTSPIAK